MRISKYPEEDKTLGQKIKKRRLDLKKNLLEIAQKAKITESYLSRIEADKKIPSPEVAERIAAALDVSPSEYYQLIATDALTTTFAQSSVNPLDLLSFKKISEYKPNKKQQKMFKKLTS